VDWDEGDDKDELQNIETGKRRKKTRRLRDLEKELLKVET